MYTGGEKAGRGPQAREMRLIRAKAWLRAQIVYKEGRGGQDYTYKNSQIKIINTLNMSLFFLNMKMLCLRINRVLKDNGLHLQCNSINVYNAIRYYGIGDKIYLKTNKMTEKQE